MKEGYSFEETEKAFDLMWSQGLDVEDTEQAICLILSLLQVFLVNHCNIGHEGKDYTNQTGKNNYKGIFFGTTNQLNCQSEGY